MIKDRFRLGVDAAGESGRFLRGALGKTKGFRSFAHDIKLPQDVESERRILRLIGKYFPEDGFVSEEKGGQESRSGYTWVIDPLDGTVNYYMGIPHSCVSIACRYRSRTVFGVVYDFFKDEMFTGRLNRGAFLNGRKIRTSRTPEWQAAVVGFGLMKDAAEIKAGARILTTLAGRVKKIRMFGAAALDLCYVGCGRLDAFLERGLHPWDTAAGALIVRAAGGRVKESGEPGRKLLIAVNGALRRQDLPQEEIEP